MKGSWLSSCTWKWDVDNDDDDAQHDGDDTEQTSQSTESPGPVNVPLLQAVSGLETHREDLSILFIKLHKLWSRQKSEKSWETLHKVNRESLELENLEHKLGVTADDETELRCLAH